MSRNSMEEDFEGVYLRHDYIKRAIKKNGKLDGKYVKIYEPIVVSTARIMYEKLYHNFMKVGFELEDVIATTNMYMLVYIGIYSIENNSEEKEKMVKKFIDERGREPTEKEIKRRDRNRLINFLRQRLQHCGLIFSRKARNITVGIDKRYIFAETSESIPATHEAILNNHKKYKYRKVTTTEFKEILKNNNPYNYDNLYDKHGYKVIYIERLNNGISNADYITMTNLDIVKNNNPEEILINAEHNKHMSILLEKFNLLDENKKIKILKKFVSQNKGKRALKNEIKLAKKILNNNNNGIII